MTFQKNQIYTVKIEDIGTEGEGIGKIEGFSLFVKDALPGDVAKVRLTKVKKNYAYARLEEVFAPSPDRVEPPCPFHRQCGGCQIQALSYEKQLAFKQSKVENNLVRIWGFPAETIREVMEPIIGMDEPWRYRNKAQYPFGYGKNGELVTGFYAGRTHSIIANTDCLLGAAENKEILEIILDHMRRYQVPAYREETGEGLIRHVLIRKGFSSGELMVCIVINRRKESEFAEKELTHRKKETMCAGDRRTFYDSGQKKRDVREEQAERKQRDRAWIPEQNKLADRLAMVHGMTSISLNFNNEKTNVIMGAETVTIWGRDKIRDTMHLFHVDGEEFVKTDRSVTYEISPRSFYQVNSVQAEKLYSTALDYAGLTGKETVWDLYCGIGTISLFLAQAAGQVYGVEVIPEAVEDARENARKNGIGNAEFFVGEVEKVLPEFYEREREKVQIIGEERKAADESGAGIAGKEEDRTEGSLADRENMCHPDVIVVDPPRKGCDEVCLQTILKMQPERVVYVSCDSATLARDLKTLCEGGYVLKRARVCDQFCQGVHVETVVMLSHKKPDSVINVKVEFGEGEGKVPLDNIAKRAAAYKPKERVTYKMIKEYIEAKYGFKVHTAYIAEVKRDLGLPMYDAPNAVEELKQPRKHPTAEKAEAIKDALKHFKLLVEGV